MSALAFMAHAMPAVPPLPQPLLLPLTAQKMPLAGHMAMWFDPAGTATWQQARAQTFTPAAANINLGYLPGVLWVRMQVQRAENLSGQPMAPDWLLDVPPAYLDEVTLWVEPSGDLLDGQALEEPSPQKAGAAIHPDLRPLWHRHSVFLVNLPEAGPYTLWLRVATDNVTAVTPVLWHANALEQDTQIKTMSAGLFYGIFICITLTALILGLTVGTPIFLLCAGFFFLLGLNLFIADGWFGLLLFPARPHLADILSSGCMALLIPVFVTIFARLLQADQYVPRLVRAYLRMAWAAALVAVLLLLGGHYSQLAPIVNMLAMLQLLVIAALALWVMPREPSLRWVPLALAPLLLPGMLRLARNAGFDFYIAWVDASLLAGITVHAMLLLFFVSRHVGQTYKSNLQARVEAIAGAAQLAEQRDFVSLLSHEFRNPMAVLDGALSNLSRKELDAETGGRVGRMGRAVERLNYVLGYCLADERLATLTPTQRPRLPLTASDIIEESLRQLDDESGRVQRIPADPASQGLLNSAHVLGDLPMLGAALKNLLDNALKYDPSGPVLLSVQVHAGQVTFTVQDHGPGINKQERSRLFDKFMRGQQHLHLPGVGLGLPLSLKIVQQHGGDLHLRNAAEGGAVAELTLPLLLA
ncbi:MAG: ATP-binding protein [Polaromonas sp.]|nr:ATP-binding protein [Polaromonas sp.]